jgi:hypothetical protein
MEFQFVTTTLSSHGAKDKETQRIVRSHAKLDANFRKRMLPSTNVQETAKSVLPEPLAPQSHFTTKFRLDKKATPRCRTKSPTSPTKVLGACNSANHYKAIKDIPDINLGYWRQPVLQIQSVNDAYDPFDSLPVRLGRKQRALIQYRRRPDHLKLLFA